MRIEFTEPMTVADLRSNDVCVIIQPGQYEVKQVPNPYGGQGAWYVFVANPQYGWPVQGWNHRAKYGFGVKFI